MGHPRGWPTWPPLNGLAPRRGGRCRETAARLRTSPSWALRSSRRARGRWDGWPGLVSPGSAPTPAPVSGRLAALPGSVGCPLGPPAPTSSDMVGKREVGPRSENLNHLPGRGRPALGNREETETSRFLIQDVTHNHLWSLFKGEKKIPRSDQQRLIR